MAQEYVDQVARLKLWESDPGTSPWRITGRPDPPKSTPREWVVSDGTQDKSFDDLKAMLDFVGAPEHPTEATVPLFPASA